MAKVIVTRKNYYEVEFQYKDHCFYAIEDFRGGEENRELKVFDETEYLLNYENAKPFFEVRKNGDEVDGMMPTLMAHELEKALEIGRFWAVK